VRHASGNFRNGLQDIGGERFIAAIEGEAPDPVFNLKYSARPVQAPDWPGDFLMKARMPDFLVAEELRLDDRTVALLDIRFSPGHINIRRPILVPEPKLLYPPGTGGAYLANGTL